MASIVTVDVAGVIHVLSDELRTVNVFAPVVKFEKVSPD
jgi:hypothetical protein